VHDKRSLIAQIYEALQATSNHKRLDKIWQLKEDIHELQDENQELARKAEGKVVVNRSSLYI